MKEIEVRFLAAKTRAKEIDGKTVIEGHGATFNVLSEDLGGFRERIMPGAFSDVLLTDDVRALFNHDPNFVLGRNKSGTLALAEDEAGLAYRITPPDSQTIRDLVLEPMKRGDITGSSFSFIVGDETMEKVNGEPIRTIHKIAALYDVGPVTFPAYPSSDSSIRGAVVVSRAAVHQSQQLRSASTPSGSSAPSDGRASDTGHVAECHDDEQLRQYELTAISNRRKSNA